MYSEGSDESWLNDCIRTAALHCLKKWYNARYFYSCIIKHFLTDSLVTHFKAEKTTERAFIVSKMS